MAFVSSLSSTNEVNTAYGVSTANTQVSPASTQVCTASTQVSTANLNNLEEMDLKWQLALLSMRTRRNQDSSRRTVNVEETSFKAMVAIDGASFDWSYMEDDEVPTNMALMAFSDSKLVLSMEVLTMYRLTAITIKGKGWPIAVNTARPNSVVVNAVRANQVNAVKASTCWVWSTYHLNCASFTLNDIIMLTDGADSRTVPILSDSRNLNEDIYLLEGGAKMRENYERNNMYSVDMKNIIPKESLTCLVAKATLDESMLWHRRLDGLLFDSSSKNASNDKPQPSSDAAKKDDEGVNKKSGIDDQERHENSTQDVNAAEPSINTASTNVNTGSLNINIVSPTVTTAPLEATHANFFSDEIEVDMSNITTTYPVPSTLNKRIHKDHSLDHVIGYVQSGVQTRRITKTTNEQGFISAVFEGKTHEDLHTCLFAYFLSQKEPKKVIQALKDPSWIKAMQEELLQFKLQQVWTLVDLLHVKRAIGTKWVYRNKKDKRGIVIRNKARLVAQGYTQKEGIDYDVVFALVARIEAIRLFLAYASFKDFVVYQMDMKSAFLYGKIEEEVYVCQAPGFEDPEFPDKVYKVEKALLGSSLVFLELVMEGTLSTIYWTRILERIFRYLKGQPKLGLWYLKDSPFDLESYTDNDYAGASLDRKSTTGGCQFLGSRLISQQCKKQTIVGNSTTKAEYVAAAS
ncbi:putative ribonuclease H-like domain-containing protein [Tanacetum coccineum]